MRFKNGKSKSKTNLSKQKLQELQKRFTTRNFLVKIEDDLNINSNNTAPPIPGDNLKINQEEMDISSDHENQNVTAMDTSPNESSSNDKNLLNSMDNDRFNLNILNYSLLNLIIQFLTIKEVIYFTMVSKNLNYMIKKHCYLVGIFLEEFWFNKMVPIVSNGKLEYATLFQSLLINYNFIHLEIKFPYQIYSTDSDSNINTQNRNSMFSPINIHRSHDYGHLSSDSNINLDIDSSGNVSLYKLNIDNRVYNITMNFEDLKKLRANLQSLIDCLNKEKNLQAFSISNAHFDVEKIIEIFQILLKKKSLKRISLSSIGTTAPIHPLASQEFANLIKNVSTITDIGLKGTNIYSDQSILNTLQSINSTILDQLSLIREPITNEVGVEITRLLNISNPSSLRIFPSSHGYEGCEEIFLSLPKKDTVSRLLVGGRLTELSKKLFSNYLQSTQTLKLLQTIIFSFDSFYTQMIKGVGNNKSLEILSIQFAGIPNDDYLEELKNSFRNNFTIHSLYLEGIPLSKIFFSTLTEILNYNSSLKVLRINNISRKETFSFVPELIELKKALENNFTFQNLSIRKNDLNKDEMIILEEIEKLGSRKIK